MDVFAPLRAINRHVKAQRMRQMGRRISCVRRIERFSPPPGKLVVAMTFDDGPTAAPARPGSGAGLSETLLEAMAKYGARGTFDVVGTTAGNYPDRAGSLGTALWSGVKYDHYPEFGRDEQAGVVSQTGLARRMLAEGHELANHGYTHVAFGPSRIVYGSRGHFRDSEAVYQDLRQLHELVRSELGYEMRLSRPPHYIDGIPDGRNAYDVYARLGYNYLAASFDGGGWKPSSGDYRADVEAMVAAVRVALERDPASLNGQIIFQKDGYNMSLQSPIVDALPRQLALLRDYGYQVVTASELMAMSPFTDAPPDQPYSAAVAALAGAGYCIGFRDNSFRPDQPLRANELQAILAGPWPASDPGAGTGSQPGAPMTARQLAQAVIGAGARSGGGGHTEASLLALLPAPTGETPVARGWAALVIATTLGLM